METDFTQQQIKTMFKVAKRLQYAFSDVKRLTTKYLIKVKKIKTRKAQAYIQRQQRKKQQEIQRKKKQKYQSRKSQKDKEKSQKQKEREAQQKKRQQQQEKPQLRSIYSIIRPEKSKPKQDKKVGETQQKKKGKGKQQNEQTEQKIIEKPIEPQSPYFQFLRIKRNQIKASIPNAPMEQTSKIMRTLWDNMTDEQRRPFVQDYQAKKAKYERDMIAYYQQPKRNKIEAKKKDEERQKYLIDFDFVEELGRM